MSFTSLTTPSLMSTGKGCYKWRSSGLLHVHVCTSTLTHMNGHTRTYTQWFICCCQQPVPDSLSSKRGIATWLMGFRKAGLEETSRSDSTHYQPLETSASSLLLLRSIFKTSPRRHPVWEVAQLISAVARARCCLANTCMLCVRPGGHPRSCWAQRGASGMGATSPSGQSSPEHIQHISDARGSPKGGMSFAIHSSGVRISAKTYIFTIGT